jgi:CubicO group peptidase (beta-lactamase class C family)
MRLRLLAAVVLLTAGIAGSCEAQVMAKTAAEPDPKPIENFLRSEMQKRRIPGMQVAVVHHGKIVLLGAYGLANVEHSVPVTNDTVFAVHSITKAFVGVAMMQLVEAGKVDLAAPASRYLDGFPEAWTAITITELLTHTSGLPDIWDNDARQIDYDDDVAWAKVLGAPVQFAPGERFQYTQTNYILLGKIIDKLSGQPFVDFIRDRQFNVVGMPNSGFGDSHDVIPHMASEYWYMRNVHDYRVPSEQLQASIRDWPPFVRTAAGLNTTAEELARWTIALQEGKLLKKESLSTLWTPGLLNDGSHQGFSPLLDGYALGWPVATRAEHPVVGPTGGGCAVFFLYPKDDLTVVLLTNLGLSAPQSYVEGIAAFYLPDLHPTR